MPKKRKGRRARGTGALFFHAKRKVWVGRIRVAGRTREVSAPTQAEVVAKLARLRPPGPDVTLADWSARWLSGLSVRPSTRVDYAASFALHVNPSLGGCRVEALTAHAIELAAASWKGSANTVRKLLSHLRICLSAATRAGLRPDNPASTARKPKGSKKKIDLFPPDHLLRIVRAATKKGGPSLILALLASTGLRLGEAMGLQVDDWDAAKGTVDVSKTFSVPYGVRPPKSPHSVRVVRVPSHARPAVVAAVGGRKVGALFRASDVAIRLAWRATLKRLRFKYRKPHTLRHSVATAQIDAGDSPANVAKYLGDTVLTIVKTYLHPTPADPAATMEKVFSRAARGAG